MKNLVFEGGGVLGIAYLGGLKYLDETNRLNKIEKVAGTSIGAITACLVSFNTSYNEIKKLADSIDYNKLKNKVSLFNSRIPNEDRIKLGNIFGDINSIYRLINHYGWYSSEYFYEWIKNIIASKFDKNKKKPPYTFKDWRNNDIHIGGIPFKDLSIIGTDITNQKSVVFSYHNTPDMEVAEAILISMSVPFLFEAVKKDNKLYADGGIMRNYPITLYDIGGVNYETLGFRLSKIEEYKNPNNIIEYIINIFGCLLKAQEDNQMNNYTIRKRTINIETEKIFTFDFNIDESRYNYLFNQGYIATKNYFINKKD